MNIASKDFKLQSPTQLVLATHQLYKSPDVQIVSGVEAQREEVPESEYEADSMQAPSTHSNPSDNTPSHVSILRSRPVRPHLVVGLHRRESGVAPRGPAAFHFCPTCAHGRGHGHGRGHHG